jgi:hypothetical protein
MRRFANILSLTLLACVAWDSVTFAKDFPKGSFTLTLPDHWVEVPPSVLTAAENALRKRAPKAVVPSYDYAFQPATSKTWLTYPYILVQVNNSGKVPESELKALPKIDTNELLRANTKSLKPIISELSVGRMQFDETEHVVWMAGRLEAPGVGKIQGLTAVIPHDRGTLTLHGYALEKNFAKFEPTFRQVVKSTTISSQLPYTPRWTDHIPVLGKLNCVKMTDSALLGAIGGAIIGALAALLAAVRSMRHDAA